MLARKLDRSQWRSAFDLISKEALAKRAEIEVAALPIGDQIEAEWLPLLGIVYDRKDDVVEIALEGVDHIIRSPQDVHVVDEPSGVTSVIVVDGDDTRHIVRLRDPLMLPAPVGSDAGH